MKNYRLPIQAEKRRRKLIDLDDKVGVIVRVVGDVAEVSPYKKAGTFAKITIDLEFGSEFQRLAMLGYFEKAVMAGQTFFNAKHKKNKIIYKLN